MKVLVTGITGFIGTNFAKKYANSKKYELIGMARPSSKTKELEKMGIKFRCANLLEKDSLKDVTKGIDVVVHLAANMSFHDSWQNLYKPNVLGTKYLVKDAIKNKVDHFIYISSTEATGPVDSVPGDEKSSYTPTYDYGKTKQLAEIWLKKQYKEKNFPVTILRPTGVYGPKDLYVSLSTVRAISEKKLKILPAKGNTFIHFTYVDDIVQGIIKTMDQPEKSIGQTFIISGDGYLTYKEMFTTIAKILNISPPKISVPSFLARSYVKFIENKNKKKGIDDFVWHTTIIDDMKTNRAYSNKKAKEVLGFKPKYSYRQGIKKTIDWYKSKNLID